MTEANFSFTTKINGDLFTIRGNTIQEFDQNLQAARDSGIGVNISAMVRAVNNAEGLGRVLGGELVDPVLNPEPQQQSQPQQQAQPQQQDPWGQGNQQPQGQWAQPQQPMQNQPQQGGGWGAPPQQQQGGWGGQPQGGQQGGEAWRADASIQPPHLQPPMTPFGPAKYWGKNKPDGKQSRAWADPRPFQQTKNLPKDQKFWQWIDDKDL